MKPNVFPVEHSIVSGQALIERVLIHYDLPASVTCRLYSSFNDDIYLITAGGVHFMLRVYLHGKFSQDEIEAEAKALAFLVERGIPAVRPIPGLTGRFVYEVQAPEGARFGMLYAHVDGTPPRYNIQPEQSACYGLAVARMHNAFDELTQQLSRHQIDFAYLVDAPLALAEPFFTSRRGDWAYLCEVASFLQKAIGSLSVTSPAYGLCHGDLHKANLLLNSSGELTIIDWDCLGYGWRAYDVAVLRWSIGPAVGPEGIGEPRLSQVWDAYLRSYESLRPLSDTERMSIPYLVAMRHIRVLGWEITNFVTGRWGIGSLNEDFLDDRLVKLRTWMKEGCHFS
jgi:Ser/Thr protein kinase RdoA (MazF antagonist)